VLLATPPEEESYWLERGLLTKAHTLAGIPVTQVVVTSGSLGSDAILQSPPGRAT
jgi:hypothetical protein